MIPAVDRPAPELASTELSGTPVREVVRSGSDPEAALEFYREVYDGRDMAFEPSPEGFGFRYRATGDDRVSLRTSSVSAARSGILAPERQYLLAWSVEGGIVVDDDRADAVTLRPASRCCTRPDGPSTSGHRPAPSTSCTSTPTSSKRSPSSAPTPHPCPSRSR